jgi:hypothetical protein
VACFGEYEIVTTSQSVNFTAGDATVTVPLPTGKRAIYGWLPSPQVALLRGRPVQDGAAWEFVLRNAGGGAVSVDLAVSCAYLD